LKEGSLPAAAWALGPRLLVGPPAVRGLTPNLKARGLLRFLQQARLCTRSAIPVQLEVDAQFMITAAAAHVRLGVAQWQTRPGRPGRRGFAAALTHTVCTTATESLTRIVVNLDPRMARDLRIPLLLC
jgi:hypothetical protein